MFFKNKKNNRQENKYLMEIYKDISNTASKEFEKLINRKKTKNSPELILLISPHSRIAGCQLGYPSLLVGSEAQVLREPGVPRLLGASLGT